MSKLLLKKELSAMTREQIIEIVLDLYSSRKDAKEYFEFFLDPDIEKLTAKYLKLISTELVRHSRYDSKARISRIKKYVKEYSSFNPGNDYVVKLMITTIGLMGQSTNIARLTDKQVKSYGGFLAMTIDFAQAQSLFTDFLEQITRLLKISYSGRMYLRDEFVSVLNQRGIDIGI